MAMFTQYAQSKRADDELQMQHDQQWLSGHANILKDLAPAQRIEYMQQLATADPERFKRVFNIDPSEVTITPTAEETAASELAKQRTAALQHPESFGPFGHTYRGAMLTDTKLDPTIQNAELAFGLGAASDKRAPFERKADAAFGAPDPALSQAQDVLDLATGKQEKLHDRLTREETIRTDTAKEQETNRSNVANEVIERDKGKAYAANEYASAGMHNAQTRHINAQTTQLTTPQGDVASLVQAVIADPTGNAYHEIKDKATLAAVTRGLVDAGYTPPRKQAGTEIDRLNNARTAVQLIDDMQSLTDKWKQRGVPLNGIFTGNINSLTNAMGGASTLTVPSKYKAEYEQDVAQFKEWRTALVGAEARALVGGRPPESFMKRLDRSLPDLGNADNKLAGNMKAARQRASAINDAILANIWGTRVPDSARARNQSLAKGGVATPAPSGGPRNADEYLKGLGFN